MSFSIYELEFDMKIRLCSVWIKKPCYNCGVKSKNFWLVKTISFTGGGIQIIKRRYCLVCCLTRTAVIEYFDGKLSDVHLKLK